MQDVLFASAAWPAGHAVHTATLALPPGLVLLPEHSVQVLPTRLVPGGQVPGAAKTVGERVQSVCSQKQIDLMHCLAIDLLTKARHHEGSGCECSTYLGYCRQSCWRWPPAQRRTACTPPHCCCRRDLCCCRRTVCRCCPPGWCQGDRCWGLRRQWGSECSQCAVKNK